MFRAEEKIDPENVFVGVIVSNPSCAAAISCMRDLGTARTDVNINGNNYVLIKSFGKSVAVCLSGHALSSNLSSKISDMQRDFPNIKLLASLGLTHGYIPEKDAQLQLGDVVTSGKRGVVRVSQVSGEILDSADLRFPGKPWLDAVQAVEQENKLSDVDLMVESSKHVISQFPESKQSAWQKPKSAESARDPRFFECVIPISLEDGKNFDKINQLCKTHNLLCIDTEATGMSTDNVSFIIIRGISKTMTDKRTNEDSQWANYTACTAAGYLRLLTKHLSVAPKLALPASRGFSLGIIASNIFLRDQVEALFGVNKLKPPVEMPIKSDNVWSYGKIGNRHVVMISPPDNKNMTQDTMAQMKDQLRIVFPEIDDIASLGFASIASPKKAQVGDVAVSQSVINFELMPGRDSKEINVQKGLPTNPPGTLWLQAGIVAEAKFGQEIDGKKMDDRKPQAIRGPIGCSLHPVVEAQIRDAVHAKTGVIALDTESTGLANDEEISYVMIRGLTGLADGKSIDEAVLKMTAHNVAKYLERIISMLPKNSKDRSFWPAAERKVERVEQKAAKPARALAAGYDEDEQLRLAIEASKEDAKRKAETTQKLLQRMVRPEPTKAEVKPSVERKVEKIEKVEKKEETYPEMTQDFLNDTKQRSEKLKAALEALGELSYEEEEKLKKFEDFETLSIMLDPVKFNDRIYSLKTLLKYINKKDPLTNKYTVTKNLIQPARAEFEELEKWVHEINQTRLKSSDKSEGLVDGIRRFVLGGP